MKINRKRSKSIHTEQTQINTEGGSVVQGAVNTYGGDFVGRDKNIYTTSVKIPRWQMALLGLSVIIITGITGVIFYRSLPEQTMPQGTFNIAVAEFSAVDKNNLPLQSDIGIKQAQSVARFIKLQKLELAEIVGRPVEVWGDQERIKPLAPHEEPVQRANSLQARVLVYGIVKQMNETEWTVSPAFFLTDQAVQQANELIGEHILGTPISVESGNLALEANLAKEMRTRVKALELILMGLSNYGTGKINNYLEATQFFQQAADDPAWGKAPEKKGQEVLYLFLGNSYLKSASLTDDQKKYQAYIEKSREAYEKAIEYNPSYARTYNALGSLHFELARLYQYERQPCKDDWDWVELDTAKKYYEKALGSPDNDKPQSGNVDMRAHLGLGRIYYYLGLCLSNQLSPDAWQQARAYHRMVVDEYGRTPATYLQLLASLAYLDLADIAYYEAIWRLGVNRNDLKIAELTQQALENYQKALDELGRLKTEETLRLALIIEIRFIAAICTGGQATKARDTLEKFVAENAIPEATRSALIEFSSEFSQGTCHYDKQNYAK